MPEQIKKWSGALVGFGFIAERAHLPVFYQHRDDIDLKAVIDPSEARRRKARELKPGVGVFPDMESFFASSLAHEVDFIDCCAPSAQHAELALRSLQRGFHVLCEKPLSLDRSSSDRLREAARRAEKTLMPVHNYRFAPVFRQAQRLLQAGHLGQLKRVHLEIHRPSHAKGVSEWDPHWRRVQKWSGGGVSVDHGSHALYLICSWFQLLPIHVQASFQSFGPGLRGWQSTEEESYIEAKFPAGGQARISLSWKSSARKIKVSLIGEQGSVFIDDDSLEVAQLAGNGTHSLSNEKFPSDWNDASHALWLEPVLNEFFEAISRGDVLPRQTEIALHLGSVFEDFAEMRMAVAQNQGTPRPARLRQQPTHLRVLTGVTPSPVPPSSDQQGAAS